MSRITVYEHERLYLKGSTPSLNNGQLEALRNFHGEGCPYFSLIHNGIKFCEYVGVLQVGTTTIEILPKADKSGSEQQWRTILIDMLKSVNLFDVHAPSSSSLKLRPHSILDLYFELFIIEIEYLQRRGLLKKYRKKSGNVTTLKGAIKFNQQIQQNLIHKERFFTDHTVYDVQHEIHFILYKTIVLLNEINTDHRLQGKISSLLLYFPEMPDIKINDETFLKLNLKRKDQVYKKALEISHLLLLNYHPDLTHGHNHVLALMFDMNDLWEKFIFYALRRQLHKTKTKLTISAQTTKSFWKPSKGRRTSIRPDIVINANKENCIVLDTKWKNLGGWNPSIDDLRQMYVYHDYYQAKKVALVYPGNNEIFKQGRYLDPKLSNELEKECSILPIPLISENVNPLEEKIFENFMHWFNS